MAAFAIFAMFHLSFITGRKAVCKSIFTANRKISLSRPGRRRKIIGWQRRKKVKGKEKEEYMLRKKIFGRQRRRKMEKEMVEKILETGKLARTIGWSHDIKGSVRVPLGPINGEGKRGKYILLWRRKRIIIF